MLSSYRNLKISTKLLLSNLAFALPMVVLIFFMNISFEYDINIGKTELAGTRCLRSLFLLIERIPEHFSADTSRKDESARKVQGIFDDLHKFHADITHVLELKEESHDLYDTVHVSLETLQDQWHSLASSSAGYDEYERLLKSVQDFISLSGRKSKLAIDPTMDSKVLADILIARLPDNFNTLTTFFHRANIEISTHDPERNTLINPDLLFAGKFQEDLVLFRATQEKIAAEGQLVLAADAGSYGLSISLQNRFGKALEAYQLASEELLRLLERIDGQSVPKDAYLSVVRKARESTRQLFFIGIEELDVLIEKRIASYRHWHFLGFACGAAALLLASFFIYSIAESITRPIRAIINYTRKIGNGDYDAPLAGEFQGELKTLTSDLKGMVHEIVYLAAFPQEAPNPVLAANSSGDIVYQNPGTDTILESLDIDIQVFLPPNHHEIIAAVLQSGQTRSEIEARILDVVYSWNYHPLVDQGLVHMYARDITLQKQYEEQLQHDAFHDGLTNLPNRALFIDRLEHIVDRCSLTPVSFAVMFLDLDRFKLVNDSLGHKTGDLLLIAVARRIESYLKSGDTLARLGGDEFALLLEDVTAHQAVIVADRILAGLKQAFLVHDYELSVATSIGIVVKSCSEQVAVDILRDADIAMYRAKARGGDSHMIFDDTMHKKALERLEMEVALKRGIERDEFVVYYQPIVDLAENRIAGFEALVRWQHPEQGLILPGVFIPLAEETGLIIPLGKKVLSIACHQARIWQNQISGHEDLLISVNLAVPQLTSATLLDDIDLILRDSGLAANKLKLEVTESGIMGNVEASLAVLMEITRRGIALGIDDFGTGNSSLSYLHRFPFDTLKVDRAFVVEMERDEKNKAIIRAIVALAHGLEKKVITEGIETKAQLEQIKQFGCEYGQGNIFSKPPTINSFNGNSWEMRR